MVRAFRQLLPKALGALVIGLLFTCDGPRFVEAGPRDALDAGEVVIETAVGGRHRSRVEIARTAEQQMIGLMYRRRLAADAGMLFDYPEMPEVAMWMKNTLIPLDIIYIGANGRIVRIYQRAVPHSLTAMPSGGPVRGVLEVNGGTVDRLVVSVGDKVRHPLFEGAR